MIDMLFRLLNKPALWQRNVCGSPYTGEVETMCFVLERRI